MKNITGIILAAGTSSRMGQTKQLLPFGSTNLLGRVVQAARSSDLDQVVVVLGHHAEEIQKETNLIGTRIVVNHRYADGQAASLCTGLAAIDWDCSGAMFLLADQPMIDHQVINTLIEAWQTCDRQIMIPYCNGVRGNPVVIGAALFEALSRITGDRGARAIFDAHRDQIEKIDIPNPAILADVDTQEAYQRLVES